VSDGEFAKCFLKLLLGVSYKTVFQTKELNTDSLSLKTQITLWYLMFLRRWRCVLLPFGFWRRLVMR